MYDTSTRRPTRQSVSKTTDRNRDHPELFIHRRSSATAKRNFGHRGSETRLSGMFKPAQINSSTDLNELSYSNSLDAKISAKSSKIPSVVASVVELLMWHDSPKKVTKVKIWQIHRRIATELQLPLYAFARGGWKKKIRDLVDFEVERQNSRPQHPDDYLKDQYNLYPLNATPSSQTKIMPENEDKGVSKTAEEIVFVAGPDRRST